MGPNSENISRLKFIGKIKKGEKINTRYMYIQPEGIVTTLSRTFFYQDNRVNSYNFCKETINNSLSILEEHEKINTHESAKICNNILTDLEEALKGLENLRITYIEDVKFCCDIDTIIELIKVRLLNAEINLNPIKVNINVE